MEKIELQDPLRDYFDSERIEKAPDGFTGNIMTRIGLEANVIHYRRGFLRRFRIPVISVAVIALFVLVAVIIPVNQTETGFAPIMKIFSNLRLSVPDINIIKGGSLHFPGWTIYGFAGLVLIALVDKGLWTIFHKSDRQGDHGEG